MKTTPIEWWEDKGFTKKLDREFVACKKGKVAAYTLSDVEVSIDLIKQRRKAK
jgi:hypothetical protein